MCGCHCITVDTTCIFFVYFLFSNICIAGIAESLSVINKVSVSTFRKGGTELQKFVKINFKCLWKASTAISTFYCATVYLRYTRGWGGTTGEQVQKVGERTDL